MLIGNCKFADDALYDIESNTWVRFEESGFATVGISSILAWLGGPVSSVTLKPVGSIVEKGKALGAMESARHFDTVRSPLTGRIVSTNEAVVGNPRLLNRDPYGEGWFARLEPLRKTLEVSTVKPPSMVREDLASKIAELKVRCFAEFPDYDMFEIGTECSAVLVRLDELLSGSPSGTVVHLVSDDSSSEVEMLGWSDRTGNPVLETIREGNLVHYIVKKT